MDIQKTIKAALAYMDITQNDLARSLGMTPQAWNQRIKTGKFTGQQFDKISEVIGAKIQLSVRMPDGTVIVGSYPDQQETKRIYVQSPPSSPALKIRQVAKKKGLKMKDIAASTNQSPANLSNKLSADNLTYSDMLEISDAIGCTLDVILVDKETGQVT